GLLAGGGLVAAPQAAGRPAGEETLPARQVLLRRALPRPRAGPRRSRPRHRESHLLLRWLERGQGRVEHGRDPCREARPEQETVRQPGRQGDQPTFWSAPIYRRFGIFFGLLRGSGAAGVVVVARR